ncbi:MAG: efflux RND transporter permease subunit, partial [Bacteroidota bacterium]
MINLPTTGVNRPVFTSMIFAGILLFGLLAYRFLPRDMLPDIEIPTLTVVTLYPGASAGDVERQVTQPLEEVLAGVTQLKNITSQSKENVSFISMQFDWETNLEDASASVRDYLEFSRRSLPDQASSPMVLQISSDMFPVIIYGVTAEENFADLGEITDDLIANALKRAPGVGSLVLLGKPEKEVQINLDPIKMNAYGINISMIAQVLQTHNQSIPGGSITTGQDETAITVPAEFKSLEDIEKTNIVTWQNQTIQIKDIATVKKGMQDTKELVHIHGKPALGIFVQKQAGANILEVVEAVRKEMKGLEPLLPDGIEVIELMDNSEMVTATLDNLFNTILYAGIFVMIVVIFFLRRIKSSLIIFLTIPFSLIVAFIFMYLADFTINIFSLMSLAIAIGMVIDNAIVVLENISRHIENGVPPKEAAIYGTREMSLPILAATLTTISVFIPLVFLDGVVGIMFRQLALITSVTLLASLFTALLLTPMLSAQMLSIPQKQNNRFFNFSEKFFLVLENYYGKLLNKSLINKKIIVFILLILAAATIWMGRNTGTDYIPEFDAGDLSVVFETRVGSSTEQTMQITRKVEKIFTEEIPEIRNLYSLTGQSDEGLLSSVGFREGKNVSTVFARTVLPEKRERTSKEMAEKIRKRLIEIPEIENFSVSGGSLISSAVLGNVKPIQLKVSGKQLNQINKVAQTISDTLSQSNFLTDIENTIDRGKPEFQIITDRYKVADLALNPAMVALQIRQSIFGQQAGEWSQNGNFIPINLRYSKQYRDTEKSLENILITNIEGNNIYSGQIAHVEYGKGSTEIKREDQQRIVYISANPQQNISLGNAAKEIEKMLNKIEVPRGVTIQLSGQVEEQRESFSNLYLMFVIGFILVFMVMASQFESMKHPFVILFAIPFTLTGVTAAFWITNLTLSVVTFLGMIMLLGVVVNNAIVLVDYTNLLRKRGLTLDKAIRE